jgi:hypothetical protein
MMELVIKPSGEGHCIYAESIDLNAIGSVCIRRASRVEPTDQGKWMADLSLTHNGPLLGPFDKRTDALSAEVQWLRENWLEKVSSHDEPPT